MTHIRTGVLGVCLGMVLLWGILAHGESAMAAPLCRTGNDHTICILSIKRSAKNYWEYRAAVKIDKERRPVEIYNCRDRTRTLKTGQVLAFEPDGAGALICQLLYR